MCSRFERLTLLAALLLVGGCWQTATTAPGGAPAASSDGADPMPSRSPNAPTPPASNPTPQPTAAAVRIAAGATAAYTDPAGQAWAADSGFDGGVTSSNATPVAIAGTDAAPLYNSERYGSANGAAASFRYTLAVPNGAYSVRLGFAELYVTAAGQRLFDVSIDGNKVLTAFDIFAAAGAMNTAVVKSFPVTVTSGQIVISFDPGSIQNPKVNTIEIIPAAGGDGGT